MCLGPVLSLALRQNVCFCCPDMHNYILLTLLKPTAHLQTAKPNFALPVNLPCLQHLETKTVNAGKQTGGECQQMIQSRLLFLCLPNLIGT